MENTANPVPTAPVGQLKTNKGLLKTILLSIITFGIYGIVVMSSVSNDISAAAPNTDFVIYNIPQLAGVALNGSLLKEMLKNPRVIGVKNSSMPVQDIQMWKDEGCIVFNGPDEQFLSGLAAGAIGGIGGTYAVMPELYLKIYELYGKGEMETARQIQNEACRIIYKMCTAKGNLYAVQKAIIRLQGGPDAGSVRLPMPPLADGDASIVREAAGMISAAIGKYC